MIPYSKHYIDKEDIDSVVNILKNKGITQGEVVQKLEKKISNYVNSKYAVAVTSCSAGLHIAANVLGIENKNVVTSPITFASTASSILHNGGNLKFVDIEKENINIDLSKIEKLKFAVNTIIKQEIWWDHANFQIFQFFRYIQQKQLHLVKGV